MGSKLARRATPRAKFAAKVPGRHPAGASPPAPARVGWAAWLRHDRPLAGAVAACALLLAVQLALTLLRPPWLGPATDGLRAALAWAVLLLVVAVARWLGRRRRPEALAWWLFGGGVACYAVAWTWWAVDAALLYPHGVPFPSPPDVLFVLQVPFYALAFLFFPFGTSPGPRLLALLDALLWTGATTAIAWYVFMAPIFAASGLSPLGKALGLFYVDAALVLLLALFGILLRPLRFPEDRPVVGLLVAGAACHLAGDAGAVWLLLQGAPAYRSGAFPDLFWIAASLLLALAALVQVRAVRRAEAGEPSPAPARVLPLDRDDLRAALRLFLPLVAALLAGAVLLLRVDAMLRAGAEWRLLLPPLLVGIGLLTLLVVRQAVQFLETARLRRAAEAARAEAAAARAREEVVRAEERAQREFNRRKDELLGVVAHELRTPLTSLEMFFALAARRLGTVPPPPPREGGVGVAGRARTRAPDAEKLQTALAYSEASVRRLERLADDLADDARVVAGRLLLRPGPCDLGEVVRAAVEEQRAAAPDRTILLELPALPGDGARPVPVLADAERIAQVVANYLTNALKYSREDRPVAVRLDVLGGTGREGDGDGHGAGEGGEWARVSVRDEGLGIPPAEQPHVWERFHVVEGNAVQSGSGTSLGLGLHICKAIVEGQGGCVGLESAPGRGSTFWFTLPIAPLDG